MTAVTLCEVSLKDLGDCVAFSCPSEVLPWQGGRKMIGSAVTGGMLTWLGESLVWKSQLVLVWGRRGSFLSRMESLKEGIDKQFLLLGLLAG